MGSSDDAVKKALDKAKALEKRAGIPPENPTSLESLPTLILGESPEDEPDATAHAPGGGIDAAEAKATPGLDGVAAVVGGGPGIEDQNKTAMESVENGLKQKDQKKETETGEVQTRDVETGLGQDEKKNNDDEIVEEKTNTDLELDETKNNTENVEVKDQTNTTSETELKQDEPKNETSEGQEETPEETKPTETTVEEPKAAEPPANKQDSQWTSDDWYWWNSWKYDGWWNWGGDDKHDTQLWSVKRDKEPSTTPSTVTSSPSNTDLQSCLERANTVDLKNAVPEGTGEKENGKPEAKDDTEETKKAQLDKKEKDKKAAHARYMRYYRSVHESPNTPEEIKRIASKASGRTAMNTCLYEAWLSCNGDWKSSRLYISICNKNRTKTTGVRRWFFRKELQTKFGVDVAADIINRNMLDEKLKKEETRMFKDLPDREDLRQFLVLDDSTETEECEEVVKQIHEAADSDDTSSEKDSDDSTSSEGKKKKNKKKSKGKAKKGKKVAKKGKKEKKKKASSSSSGSDVEASSSESKVAPKAAPKKKDKGKKDKKAKKRNKTKKEKELSPEELEEVQRQEASKKKKADANKVIRTVSTKLQSINDLLGKLSGSATNFKDAVEKDVNEKTDHMKRCRTELEAAMANDDEETLVAKSDQLKNAVQQLDVALGPCKHIKKA